MRVWENSSIEFLRSVEIFCRLTNGSWEQSPTLTWGQLGPSMKPVGLDFYQWMLVTVSNSASGRHYFHLGTGLCYSSYAILKPHVFNIPCDYPSLAWLIRQHTLEFLMYCVICFPKNSWGLCQKSAKLSKQNLFSSSCLWSISKCSGRQTLQKIFSATIVLKHSPSTLIFSRPTATSQSADIRDFFRWLTEGLMKGSVT